MPSPTRRPLAAGAVSLDAGSGPSIPQPLNLATASTPAALVSLLKALGLDNLAGLDNPSEQAQAGSSLTGTKPLSELLGEVFTPKSSATGVPKRIRLTSIDPDAGEAITHGLSASYPQMNSSTQDLAKLIKSGALVPEGPATEGLAVPQLLKKLAAVMSRR